MSREPSSYTVEKYGGTYVTISALSYLANSGRIRPLPERDDGMRLFVTNHRTRPARRDHPGAYAARVFR